MNHVFPGQRLVCWRLHTSTNIFWSTSWTAFLFFSFYIDLSGSHVLIFISLLFSFIISTGVGHGEYWSITSSYHWWDLVWALVPMWGFRVLREVNRHSGKALVPEKRQWMLYGVQPGAALHTTRQPTFVIVSPNSYTTCRYVGTQLAWGLFSAPDPVCGGQT